MIFFTYFASERLGLNQAIINDTIAEFKAIIPGWQELVSHSFLSVEMQKKYQALLTKRLAQLDL